MGSAVFASPSARVACFRVPRSAPLHAAMAARKKKFCEEVLTYLKTKFTPENIEDDDGIDVVDYLTTAYGSNPDILKQTLVAVRRRLEVLDPNWRPVAHATTVPDAPQDGEVVELWVAPWQLGFKETDAVKGKSKTHRVLSCAMDFLDRPYASSDEPLQILTARNAAVGSPILDFSLRHSVGFCKSLTARVLILACAEMGWCDDDILLMSSRSRPSF